MTSKKQAREAERRKQAKLDAKIAEREAQRDRRVRIGSLVAVVVLVIALITWGIIAFVGGGSDDAGGSNVAASPSVAETDDAGSAPEATDDLEYSTGWGTSPAPPDPSLAEGRVWDVTLDTNLGEIVLELDGANAPQATASFVALAEDDFFNNTQCHRLTTENIYVLQCGDPSATGQGGPAYSYGPIENAPSDDLYPAGTLAMARVGNDAESMGSQFFIVYDDSTIPSDAAGGYTIFGQVTQGLSIVEDVASAGTITGEPDGPPAQSVIVNEVSVE
ncbi:peptidylprolyl isomerase [Demequina sediminicola]|uniref:peptidylprolyl isomerase n=1 Tax=Demequina sediminicola TaxID=1095026 RepID=UPI000783C99D|nr:peptidylprolyl isomerase [Demequina sediminicola]